MLDKEETELKAKAPCLCHFWRGNDMATLNSTTHTHYRYRPVCEHTQPKPIKCTHTNHTREASIIGCFFNYGHLWACGLVENELFCLLTMSNGG